VKLETTLEERPGFMHALPLFDLFMTVTMLLLLGPVFLSQGGVIVELPASEFQMQRYDKSIVVTLHTGEAGPQIYVGREAVSLADLQTRLEVMKSDEVMSRAIVLLKTDIATPAGAQTDIMNLILRLGFKVALVGKPEVKTPEKIEKTDE
jgi:biopolymer transport protein ExbD